MRVVELETRAEARLGWANQRNSIESKKGIITLSVDTEETKDQRKRWGSSELVSHQKIAQTLRASRPRLEGSVGWIVEGGGLWGVGVRI